MPRVDIHELAAASLTDLKRDIQNFHDHRKHADLIDLTQAATQAYEDDFGNIIVVGPTHVIHINTALADDDFGQYTIIPI